MGEIMSRQYSRSITIIGYTEEARARQTTVSARYEVENFFHAQPARESSVVCTDGPCFADG